MPKGTEEELKIAMLLNGPNNLNGFNDPDKLAMLRKHKWDKMTPSQDQAWTLTQARTLLNEYTLTPKVSDEAGKTNQTNRRKDNVAKTDEPASRMAQVSR